MHMVDGWVSPAPAENGQNRQLKNIYILTKSRTQTNARFGPLSTNRAKQQAQQSSLQDSYLRHGTANVSELDSLSLTMEWTWCEKEQSSSQSTVRP